MTRKGLAWFTLFHACDRGPLDRARRVAAEAARLEGRFDRRDQGARKGAPITLKQAIAVSREGRDPSYYRVHVKGNFDHAKERYLYALSNDGTPGWHVITPFDSVEGDLVLVDRGFVPDEPRDPSSRAAGQLEGDVDVTGLVRLPESPGPFTPDNEPGNNRWFWRDLSGMVYSMFPTATMDPAPFFLEAEKSDVPGAGPRAARPVSSSPITICNTRSPGSCSPAPSSSSILFTLEALIAGAYPDDEAALGLLRGRFGKARVSPLPPIFQV